MTTTRHEHEFDYVSAVEDERARQGRLVQVVVIEPAAARARRDFTGLPYFAVDPRRSGSRACSSSRMPASEPSTFQIPTSDGQLRPAHRAGTFTFERDGVPRQLTGYVLDGGDEPIPCSCRSSTRPAATRRTAPAATSTSSPRTTGRTSSTSTSPTTRIASTPSRYSCPLTPAENRLPIRIEAGERLAETAEPG